MKANSETKYIAENIVCLIDYYGGACITDPGHWSHLTIHKRKPRHWYYRQQFSNVGSYIRSSN
jgi:hypothetical protein